MSDVKFIDIKEFRELGFLQEINRQFLHPLGMALSVAVDTETGEELWKGRLPTGGQANPMTYALNGRQYVVIAAGGHGALGIPTGDTLMAFSIPED